MKKGHIKHTAIIGNDKFVLGQYFLQCPEIKVYVLDQGMHLISAIHANNRNLAVSGRAAHRLYIETDCVLLKSVKQPPVLPVMKPPGKITYVSLLQSMVRLRKFSIE